MDKKENIIIGFNNLFQMIELFFYLFFTNKKAVKYDVIGFKKNKISDMLATKKIFSLKEVDIKPEPGLSYKINLLALRLVREYYQANLDGHYFIKYWNRVYNTDKIEAFLKRNIIEHVYELLLELYHTRTFLEDAEIILPNSSLDKFIVEAFTAETGLRLKIKSVDLRIIQVLIPFYFLGIMLIKLIISGVGWKEKENADFIREAADGFARKTLRDDFFIDGIKIKKEDVLIYELLPGSDRQKAFEEARKAGYRTVNLHNLSLNLKSGILEVFKNFFVYPFILFILTLQRRISFVSNYVLSFYLNAYPFYILLTNYKVRCQVSANDHGEIAETIIMNKFGCKNILYHWSDLTVAKFAGHAYLSHNSFYVWGPVHYKFQEEDYRFNNVKNVGCFLMRGYFEALKEKEANKNKSVLLCDTSFAPHIHFTELFYIQYMGVILKMLRAFPGVKFSLKPKNDFGSVSASFRDLFLKKRFERTADELKTYENFRLYSNKAAYEALLPEADLLVNMGFNTPAIVALLAGKEAVYYDRTENYQHPFSKFEDLLVFRDDEKLLTGIKKILDGKLSVHTEEVDGLLNSYDSFRDGKTKERLASALLQEINKV